MNKVICISRQYASGGHEIGRQLSNKYKIPIYDKEIILESMKISGFSQDFIESNDENTKNNLIYSIGMERLPNFTTTPYISPPGDKVHQAQAEAIRRLAQKSSCIIIGRCAGEILRENLNSVRIFVYANDEFRIDRAIRYYGCKSSEVVSILQKIDKQRATYFNHYSLHHWGTIDSFDLAIDSSRCGIIGAVRIIETYLNTIGD